MGGGNEQRGAKKHAERERKTSKVRRKEKEEKQKVGRKAK